MASKLGQDYLDTHAVEYRLAGTAQASADEPGPAAGSVDSATPEGPGPAADR
jgi:hypothetical protein